MKKVNCALVIVLLSVKFFSMAEDNSTTRFSQFFNPITESLQSIFDTIASNALVQSTVSYIKSKIDHFMAVSSPCVEQIFIDKNSTLNSYNVFIPKEVLALITQLKDDINHFIPFSKGIIVYGPSGSNEKKNFARAIASEIGCPLFAVTRIDCLTVETLDKLLAEVKNAARQSSTKCSIVFIDRIEQVKNGFALLNEMYPRSDVSTIVIGATNSLNDIANEFRLQGRFDSAIQL